MAIYTQLLSILRCPIVQQYRGYISCRHCRYHQDRHVYEIYTSYSTHILRQASSLHMGSTEKSLPTKQGKWPLLCTGCLTTRTCYDATITFSMHWQKRYRKLSHTGNKWQRESLLFSKSFPAKSRWVVEYLCLLLRWAFKMKKHVLSFVKTVFSVYSTPSSLRNKTK